MNERVRWMVIALSFALALGCGSSSKDSDANKADAGGGSGNGGTKGGSGGTKGGGSGGSTTGGTGGMAAGTGGMTGTIIKNVDCGPMVCAGSDPASGGQMLGGMAGFSLAPVCCADEAAGTCGAVSASDMMTCLPPSPVDPDCPKTMGRGGCCATDTNECGVDLSLFGRGCMGLSSLPIPPAIRMRFGLPDPTDCDGNPIIMDAGMTMEEDAGK